MSSYYGKSLYLDFDNLPRVDHRFSLGRVLAKGISAKICQGVDRDNGNQIDHFHEHTESLNCLPVRSVALIEFVLC